MHLKNFLNCRFSLVHPHRITHRITGLSEGKIIGRKGEKMNVQRYRKIARVTLGRSPADLVLKNGRILNVFSGEILPASIAIKDGLIAGTGEGFFGKEERDLKGRFVVPGFIDAHLHLESTMVSPNELVSTAARFGTTCFIVDPHEAANVSGADGINYILNQTSHSPANVYVMLPSCVPATKLDDNGAEFSAEEMRQYVHHPRVLGLGEVMDNPSVISGDKAMFAKLCLFEKMMIDGHAPFLPERELSAYALAGIRSDHEATSFDYAREEIRRGIHVHIREGSAAHNLRAIVEGILESGCNTENFSFCTDDKHIEDILREGHISYNIRLAISLGLDPVKAYQMASINTARLYGLRQLGAIAPGYQADLVVLDSLEEVSVSSVYFKGELLRSDAELRIRSCPVSLRHSVHLDPVSPKSFLLPIRLDETPVITLNPGEITTTEESAALEKCRNFQPELCPGYLKIASVERHKNSGKIGCAVAKGYGLRGGAVASSVSHDSHNILVIGDSDEAMAMAVNELIRVQGGYTLVYNGAVYDTLPLPIMGLMSDEGYEEVDRHLQHMKKKAHEMGVPEGVDPFITLSFLSLPVIPELRITPRGLCQVGENGPKLLKL